MGGNTAKEFNALREEYENEENFPEFPPIPPDLLPLPMGNLEENT